MKTVVFAFGRMNPPTIGHQKLVDKITSVAKKNKATPMLFLSHSQDKKKNPLSYDDKIKYASKAFGSIVQKSPAKTIIQVLASLQNNFDKAIIIAGSDRIEDFKKLIEKYNGKDYTFDQLEFVSAGERDPDADDVSGMSASKLRALATEGNYSEYKKGLPRKMSEKDAKDMYDTIRSNMGIKESVEISEVLTLQQRMKRRQLLRRIKGKIKRGRRIARLKLAKPEKLKSRAQKKARQLLRQRLAGSQGKKYSQLSLAARVQVDKRLEGKQAVIQRIAKQLLPKVRKAEQQRLKKARETKNEEYSQLLDIVKRVEREQISEKIEKNLLKKSEKYGVSLTELKEQYLELKSNYNEKETNLTEEQWSFNKLNSSLANQQKKQIEEALNYHFEHNIPLSENIFRHQSMNYFKLFEEAKKQFNEGKLEHLDPFDKNLLESDIGEFDYYDGVYVPLDCPMVDMTEEDKKDVELNKPKRGGPKKFYVYVKDPSTGNIKKVTFGDTSGLKAKINDPEARKSFAARHQCHLKKDKTEPGYWSCRLPYYAKSLGLSGGGNFFW